MAIQRMKTAPGMVIGLLGGSFDPPHEGHAHITREAIKRFDLDRVWWLVSPGNPLKTRGPAPLPQRLAACRALIDHPRVEITDIEAELGTRYTASTIRALQKRHRGVTFVWLMGADNLSQFDRWQEWRWMMRNVSIGVLARPEERSRARFSKAARTFRGARLAGRKSRLLGKRRPPSWCFVNVRMVAISSTMLRAGGKWPRD